MSVDEAFVEHLATSWLGLQIEVVSPDQLDAAEKALIPPSWLAIAGCSGRDSVMQTLTLWHKAIPGRLPRLLDVINRYGYSVRLARVTWGSEPKPSVVLLYVFHDPDAFATRFQMRIGFPPKPLSDSADHWGRFPADVRSLYHEVHDGFLTNLWAGPAGLIRSNEMRRVGDRFTQEDLLYYVYDGRGELVRDSAGQEVDPDPLPNLDTLLEICRSNGTARLLIDAGAGDDIAAWELWSDQLEYWPDLWERLDDWLLAAFTTDGFKPPE